MPPPVVVALVVGLPVAYLFSLIVLAVFQVYRNARILSRLPHVKSTGIWGWKELVDNPSRLPHLSLDKANELGGIYCFRVFHIISVVVTDPVLAQQVLSILDLPKSGLYDVISKLTSPGGTPNLLTHSTHSGYWRTVWRGTGPAFSPKLIRATFPDIMALTDQLCGILSTAAADAGASAFTGALDQRDEEGGYLDMSILLQRQALDVIGRAGFATDFGALKAFAASQEVAMQSKAKGAGGNGPALISAGGLEGTLGSSADVFQTFREGIEELPKRFTNPLRHRLLCYIMPDGRRGEQRLRRTQAFVKQLAKQVQARGEPGPDDESIAAHLLRIRDPQTGLPLTQEQLANEIGLFFFAGFETTGHTMSWVLYLIASHPEVESKVCAELDALGLLATSDRPNPRALRYEDMGDLKYLGMAIKEAMRLVPVVGGGSGRVADRPLVLGGYQIPAGVDVLVPFNAVMNSAHNWERPGEYLPERWEERGAEYWRDLASTPANGSADPPRPGARGEAGAGAGLLEDDEEAKEQEVLKGAADGKRPALRFIPFSTGMRNCIGQNLAKANYTATLAVLLSRFRFQLHPELLGPGALDAMQIYRTTTQPGRPMLFRVTPRSLAAA